MRDKTVKIYIFALLVFVPLGSYIVRHVDIKLSVSRGVIELHIKIKH